MGSPCSEPVLKAHACSDALLVPYDAAGLNRLAVQVCCHSPVVGCYVWACNGPLCLII